MRLDADVLEQVQAGGLMRQTRRSVTDEEGGTTWSSQSTEPGKETRRGIMTLILGHCPWTSLCARRGSFTSSVQAVGPGSAERSKKPRRVGAE